MGAGGVIL